MDARNVNKIQAGGRMDVFSAAGGSFSSAGISGMLGIHFGATEVCVSSFQGGKCYTALRMPAYAAIAETGEILAGERAVRYQRCHPGTKLYSVLEVMRAGKWKKNAKVTHRGMDVYALKMCDCLMRELRRELDDASYGSYHECVLSVSSFSFLCRRYLSGLMERAGFRVLRLQTAAASCGLYIVFAKKMVSEDIDQFLIVCAVSRNIAEINLLRVQSRGLMEEQYKLEYPLDGKRRYSAKELGALARQQLKKCGANGVDRADCYLFAEGETVIAGGSTGLLNVTAAAGDAVEGAKLSARLDRDREDILLLDVTPLAYGFEVYRVSDRQILQKLHWAIRENTTVPSTGRGILYDRRKSGGGDENLLLHIADRINGSLSERIELNLDDIRPFLRQAEQIEIKLSLVGSPDRGETLSVELKNPASGEKREIPVLLGTTDQPLPSKKRHIYRQQALTAVWEEAVKFHRALAALDLSERNSPTGQGLLMVEKQCRQFLEKQGISLEKRPDPVPREKDTDQITGMLHELLQIADGLEYGLRSGGEGALGARALLYQTYWDFQNMFEQKLNVWPVEAEGRLFDAKMHAAVAHEQREGLESSVITEEMQRGYCFGEQLLRPAAVKVAN